MGWLLWQSLNFQRKPTMRWQGRRGSENVEDRRMSGPARVGIGGGLFAIVVCIVLLLLGADPRDIVNLLQGVPQQQPGGGQAGAPLDPNNANDELAQFVAVVLADTEDVWSEVFEQSGKQYRKPTLVLFRDLVQSACGFQQAATGPFYCPLDEKVYIDLGFYEDMKSQLGAPGDFAQAYVIAHEVGHHVQKLLGISDQVRMAQQQVRGQAEANDLSVRLELQADFFAGVWANHANQKWQILEEGDIEEALNAAAAIGDDRLQGKSRGYVVPESFTHGTSEQRVKWFTRGLRTGDINEGNTFEAEDL
jgi:predicted metalloprotease